jgi:hypothetical protein
MGWETKSHLLDCNGSRGADLDATLAAQAFIHIYRLGFTVFDLEYAHRAGIHAFSLSVTLVFIHCHDEHGFLFHLLLGFKKLLPLIQLFSIIADFRETHHDRDHKKILPGSFLKRQYISVFS